MLSRKSLLHPHRFIIGGVSMDTCRTPGCDKATEDSPWAEKGIPYCPEDAIDRIATVLVTGEPV